MKRDFNFEPEFRETNSSPAPIENPSAPRKIRVKDSPLESSNKSYLKDLHGWGFQQRSFLSIPNFLENSPSKKAGILDQPGSSSNSGARVERIAKLSKENLNLKTENEYLKKSFATAKETLKESQDKIEELKNTIDELKSQLNEKGVSLANSDEESKESMPMEDIKQIARNLNCDPTNNEELESIELALKLMEEEKESMERTMLSKQEETLKALDQDGAGLNPEQMSYEELLDLEEKLGSVSKGLSAETIAVLFINL